jgi:hypothetical protein
MTAPSGEEDIEENKKVLKTVFLLSFCGGSLKKRALTH